MQGAGRIQDARELAAMGWLVAPKDQKAAMETLRRQLSDLPHSVSTSAFLTSPQVPDASGSTGPSAKGESKGAEQDSTSAGTELFSHLFGRPPADPEIDRLLADYLIDVGSCVRPPLPSGTWSADEVARFKSRAVAWYACEEAVRKANLARFNEIAETLNDVRLRMTLEQRRRFDAMRARVETYISGHKCSEREMVSPRMWFRRML